MATVSQLGYLGLNVSDLGEWEKFATELLGLEVVDKTAQRFLMRMDEYHHRFIVQEGNEDDVANIGWEVADERGLQELERQLNDDESRPSADPPKRRKRAGCWIF